MIPAVPIAATDPASKPRASGDDPIPISVRVHGMSVNPARAGMIREMRQHGPHQAGKPRASGDDPVLPVQPLLLPL